MTVNLATYKLLVRSGFFSLVSSDLLLLRTNRLTRRN